LVKHATELHPSVEFDYGPLFGGTDPEASREQTYQVDPDERLGWARRALLMTNLVTFTADDARRAVEGMRPHYLGSGRWLGGIFQCPLFERIEPVRSTREKAKARWMWRYNLTPEGVEARRKLTRAGETQAGRHTTSLPGATPGPATNSQKEAR